jgi:hypothetical protein
MAATFVDTIKPYFTPCYRAKMLDVDDTFDLWDKTVVQNNFDSIVNRVSLPATDPHRMPKAGCPEGVWEDVTRAQFLADFQAWKMGGFL